ncbi:hypothetical protein [Vogesella sp. XCS3]|uniref:hypothetical protein n=1 Tax=Vogesella sp. XCS3 TaxID=2877939 RepID=UPI001D0B8D46|nr:hypothetical protein [Vogesella sp. XCS3]UDM16689.1 hypothetical protein LCH97_15610 [Vogesella sp. XCS3]
MENALRAKPMDIREQYEKQPKELQEAYGEAMLERRARTGFCCLFVRDIVMTMWTRKKVAGYNVQVLTEH